jgi:hypothetical protein
LLATTIAEALARLNRSATPIAEHGFIFSWLVSGNFAANVRRTIFAASEDTHAAASSSGFL